MKANADSRRVRRVCMVGLVLATLLSGATRSWLHGCAWCASDSPHDAARPTVQDTDDAPSEHEMELVTVGLDMVSRSPVVLLRQSQGNQRLPVWVGILEAQGIMRALQGIEMPRPMTHDLMATLLKEMGGTLEKVTIDELRDGTYYGKLVLRIRGEQEPRIIDTRPSDGMALALRTGAPSTLGITVIRPTEEHRQQFKLPSMKGVLVIEALGEAQQRGLERGDLIIQVDDQKPTTPMEFFEAIQAAPGKKIQIRYFRGETERQLELPAELRAPPKQPRRDIA